MTPGNSNIVMVQFFDADMAFAEIERLGTPKVPAIRFTRGTSFEASRFAYVAACQVACPPSTDRTGFPAPEGFYFQASGSLVARPAAGYDYNMDWIFLCWRDFHPLEWQLASLHQNRTGPIRAYGSHLGCLTAKRCLRPGVKDFTIPHLIGEHERNGRWSGRIGRDRGSRRVRDEHARAMVVGDRPPASLTGRAPILRSRLRRGRPSPAVFAGLAEEAGRSSARRRLQGQDGGARVADQVESACRKSHDQPARVAHDAARQGDQMKPHRLHAPRRPIAAERQTLHHRVQRSWARTMIAHRTPHWPRTARSAAARRRDRPSSRRALPRSCRSARAASGSFVARQRGGG